MNTKEQLIKRIDYRLKKLNHTANDCDETNLLTDLKTHLEQSDKEGMC